MIYFTCPCGKELESEAEEIGRRIPCPDCGARLKIPAPGSPHARLVAPPLPPPAAAAREYRQGKFGLALGLTIFGLASLGSTLIVLILGLGNGPDNGRAKAASRNNLRRIGLALQKYDEVYQGLPPAAQIGPTGKPLLSWRVLILPYLGEELLFHEFKLDEPWDSPHNRQLLGRMPSVYHHAKDTSRSTTHYQVFEGAGAVFARGRAPVRLMNLPGAGS